MTIAMTLQTFIVADLCAFAAGALAATILFEARRKFRRARTLAKERQLDLGLANQCPDAILAFDDSLTCRFASAATERLLGHTGDSFAGRTLLDILGPDSAPLESAIAQARGGQPGAEAIVRATRSTGEQVWVEARFSTPDPRGRLVISLRDISTRKTTELALRLANVELNKLAGHDGLTSLANRRRFAQDLQSECRRASRSMVPISLLLLDVDHFWAFSDRYGRDAGDACLKEVAAVLRAVASDANHTAARFGGERYALMLSGADEHQAAIIAEEVRLAVSALGLPQVFDSASGGGAIGVSIGCATVRPNADEHTMAGNALLNEAEAALGEAKRRTRVSAAASSAAAEARHTAPIDLQARSSHLAAFRAAGLAQPTQSSNRVARAAAVLLDVPLALIILVEGSDLLVVGHYGVGAVPEATDPALTAELAGLRDVVVVPDLGADSRFAPLAANDTYVFGAAAPLFSSADRQFLGVLWISDRRARPMFDEQRHALLAQMAVMAVRDLERRVDQGQGQVGRAA